MKIILAGGTGHLGALLTRAFVGVGQEVVVLSRRRAAVEPGARLVEWDGRTVGPWALELEGADVLINLAGRSVNCRYHPQNRREIMESRIESTRVLGEALSLASRPPLVWLQSSTATIYAHRYDAPNDEFSGVLGGDEPGVPETWRFSIDVAKKWEETATEAARAVPSVRLVLMRTAIVACPGRGGALDHFVRFTRLGFGGYHGNGRQFVSWIHGADFVRAVEFLIREPSLSGPVNVAAPRPIPERDFMRAVRAACGVPFGFYTPRWLAEIGALFLRTETELILKSRYVVPTRLEKAGFHFTFEDWPEAVRDLCAQERATTPTSARDS